MTASTVPIRISVFFGEADADPDAIRNAVVLADKLGFYGAWIADHFMPWLHTGNESPFVWSLMGSCLEGSKTIKIGPGVTTPIGGRYHPAIIAQASATLGNMYPGRFRLSVGSGEAINEARFPLGWPSLGERAERLSESVTLIKKMWMSNEFFDFQGKYFPMEKVFLYTKPKQIPPIYFSGLGSNSTFSAGQSGDNLLTLIVNVSDVGVTLDRCKNVILPTFDAGVRSIGHDPASKEKVVGLSFGFDSKEKYLANVRNSAGLYAKGALDEPDPRMMASRDSSSVTDDDLLKEYVHCSNWDDAIDVIERLKESGATEVAFFTGANLDAIRMYSEKLFPHFRN